MFKDSNFFEFTNFPFKTKSNDTVVYSVNRNYLFSSGKQRKKNGQIVETILFIKSTVYLLIFRQSSMIFKGSPNSLKESYFTGELRVGES